MKQILIPTDFSDNAWNAAVYATQILKNKQCVFYFLHTYTPTVYAYNFSMTSAGFKGSNSTGSVKDPVRKFSREELHKISDRIRHEYVNENHTYQVISAYNLLTDEINDQVRKLNIDLIVMGTQGETDSKKVLFGSLTLFAMRKAKCPVLAVPTNYKFRKIKNILFPNDYKHPYSKDDFRALLKIAVLHKATVHTFHISNEKELSKEQLFLRETINNYFSKIKHDFTEVPDASILAAISQYIATHQIDMLTMTHRKHSFLERLFFKQHIKQLGMHLTIPLLVLPVK